MIDRLANRSEIFEHCFAKQTELPQPLFASSNFTDIQAVLVSDVVENYADTQQSKFSKIFQLHRPDVKALATTIEQTTLAQLFAQVLELLPNVLSENPDLVVVHLSGFYSAWDAPWELRQSLVEDEDPDAEDFFEPPKFDWRNEQDLDPDRTLVLQQAFLAQLRVFDTCLGVLLDMLDFENQPNVKIALTSSMGYPLGEHLLVGQQPCCLYGESIHIPFLVYDSLLEPTTYRHQSLCCAINLVDQFVSDYSQLLTENVKSENVIYTAGPDSSYAIRSKAWHFIQQQTAFELYAKPDDRWEVNEISSRCHDVVEIFQDVAKKINQGISANAIELPDRLTSIEER